MIIYDHLILIFLYKSFDDFFAKCHGSHQPTLDCLFSFSSHIFFDRKLVADTRKIVGIFFYFILNKCSDDIDYRFVLMILFLFFIHFVFYTNIFEIYCYYDWVKLTILKKVLDSKTL